VHWQFGIATAWGDIRYATSVCLGVGSFSLDSTSGRGEMSDVLDLKVTRNVSI
jgi:hypothetical protein